MPDRLSASEDVRPNTSWVSHRHPIAGSMPSPLTAQNSQNARAERPPGRAPNVHARFRTHDDSVDATIARTFAASTACPPLAARSRLNAARSTIQLTVPTAPKRASSPPRPRMARCVSATAGMGCALAAIRTAAGGAAGAHES